MISGSVSGAAVESVLVGRDALLDVSKGRFASISGLSSLVALLYICVSHALC